jgi:hypothetical protein
MDIKEFIKSPAKLRIYFSLLFLALFILIIINYFVVEGSSFPYDSVIFSILNNFIALLGSSLVIGGFYWVVTPSGLKDGDINVISSHDIKSVLNSMVEKTERFFYFGHTCRWNRFETFEKLLKDAKKSKLAKNINLIILDPDDLEVCKYYSEFGHGERNKGRSLNTALDVRIELLTTFLHCIKFNNSPLLNISIRVSNRTSFFRYDISDDAILQSTPYLGDPAMHFPKGSFFYNSYKEEFGNVWKQSRKINLLKNSEVLSNNDMRNVLSSAGFNISYIDESFIKDLVKYFNNIVCPY